MAANPPCSGTEDPQDMLPLDLLHSDSQAIARPVSYFWQFGTEHGAGIQNEISLDHITKLSDIPRPRIAIKSFQG